jgi:hypothetical protein
LNLDRTTLLNANTELPSVPSAKEIAFVFGRQRPLRKTLMKIHLSRSLSALGALFLFISFGGSEVVYDNSQTYLTNYHPSLLEYGDEIRLAGTARVVTNFQFEYFGAFLRTGDEEARIRFYANDGPGRAPAPNTLLYDSGPFPLLSGLNTAPISGISVVVPDVFTWTVQFTGITGLIGDQAGLIFYDPPTIGRSFNDYWQYNGSTWGTKIFPNGPRANFGARVLAFPDPPLTFTSTNRLTSAGFEFQLSGPLGQTVIIESSTNLVNWSSLGTNRFTTGFLNFVDSQATNLPQQFYRVSTNAP